MLICQEFADPEDEDDDDLAGLGHEVPFESESIHTHTPEIETQAILEKHEALPPESHNGIDTPQKTPPLPHLDPKQPQEHANGGEGNPTEIAAPSGPTTDSPEGDSLTLQTQTDANATLPQAPASCQNTKQPHGSRQTDKGPDLSVVRLIERGDKSAGRLVNLLATHFPISFRDEARFDGKKVRLLKRAQIFVADLWAALNANGLGEFDDIDHLTMFPGTSMCAQQAAMCMQRRSGVNVHGRGCILMQYS